MKSFRKYIVDGRYIVELPASVAQLNPNFVLCDAEAAREQLRATQKQNARPPWIRQAESRHPEKGNQSSEQDEAQQMKFNSAPRTRSEARILLRRTQKRLLTTRP